MIMRVRREIVNSAFHQMDHAKVQSHNPFCIVPDHLQDQKLLGCQRNVLTALFCDDDHILNANAQLPRQIDPRLRADDSAGRQRLAVGRRSIGIFMDFHTDAVAKAMAEIGTVSGVRDDLSGRPPLRR